MPSEESATAGALQRWWHMRPRGSLFDYCLVAWPVALVPSVLIVIAVTSLFSNAGFDVSSFQKPAVDPQTRKVWIALLAAPIIETLVLGAILYLLEFATRRRQILAVLSALAWGGAHAWFHPLWFFGTVWSFYVFSRGWLAWRPVSYKHAFAAAAVPHALVNCSALAVQFLARS